LVKSFSCIIEIFLDYRLVVDQFVKHVLLGNGRVVLGSTPEALGILPTAEARRLDSFLPDTSLYILGLAARGATCLRLSVSCGSAVAQHASYQLELRTDDGRILARSGLAIRKTDKLLISDGGSLQLEITEEFRRMRVSFVGQMTRSGEEDGEKKRKKVVFVRIQAWFQVLCSPIRYSYIIVI
jgi:hypothetical protein